MKKSKLEDLIQGLKNIRSKYYCKLSEKELSIIERVIKVIEKLLKPEKKKWTKTVWKFTESMASVISKMF